MIRILTNTQKELRHSTSLFAGQDSFDHWYKWAIRSRLEPMKQAAKMLKFRLDNLLSWFHYRITNSNAEAFNSRIQSIESNARGFKSFQNCRTRILFFCGKRAIKPASTATRYRKNSLCHVAHANRVIASVRT